MELPKALRRGFFCASHLRGKSPTETADGRKTSRAPSHTSEAASGHPRLTAGRPSMKLAAPDGQIVPQGAGTLHAHPRCDTPPRSRGATSPSLGSVRRALGAHSHPRRSRSSPGDATFESYHLASTRCTRGRLLKPLSRFRRRPTLLENPSVLIPCRRRPRTERSNKRRSWLAIMANERRWRESCGANN